MDVPLQGDGLQESRQAIVGNAVDQWTELRGLVELVSRRRRRGEDIAAGGGYKGGGGGWG